MFVFWWFGLAASRVFADQDDALRNLVTVKSGGIHSTSFKSAEALDLTASGSVKVGMYIRLVMLATNF
jgi:hypothetical protein